MATPPSSASTSNKSQGRFLFNQQARIHVYDSDDPSSQKHPPSPKPPTLTKLVSSPLITQSYQTHTPIIMHNRTSLTIPESFAHTDDDDIKLIGVHPRTESDCLQKLPPQVPRRPVKLTRSIPQPTPPSSPPPPPPPTQVSQLLETDFPVEEPSDIRNEPDKVTSIETTLSTSVPEKTCEYLDNYDDDDDVIHQENSQKQYYDSDSFDDENDGIEISTAETQHVKYDSGIHTLPLTEPSRKSNENEYNQQSSTDHQPLMAHLSQTTASEEYDSEFDDEYSPEDDDNDVNDVEEQQNQILLRQQEILWGIVQEWLRKEKDYTEQLEQLKKQLSNITVPSDLQSILSKLISQHTNVFRQIQELYRRSTQPNNLSELLTECVEALMNLLPTYDRYMEFNLVPIRKSLEKRLTGNGSSVDNLLSIPTKQCLQILSQVQDLYQIAQGFESDDKTSLRKLYKHAQNCQTFGSRQDDKINQLILKNEDVARMSERRSRDRCRLILYPDAIVCCTLKSKLLMSPKYVLFSFIPIQELDWTVPATTSDAESNRPAGGEIKSTLKSYYKEMEQQNSTPSRLTKTIREQQDKLYLSQSNLQLVFNSTLSSSSQLVILFSSAYQRQDWIDLIDKTKQDFIQRRSTMIKQINSHRLNESIIQKRLDLIKPNQSEPSSNDVTTENQTSTPLKPCSGTLSITVHSVQGPALFNSGRGFQTLPANPLAQQQFYKKFLFYVAVEVDSYNMFYPYAQTSKEMIQQHDTVEFKDEVFPVEIEHSRAFRLLIYRFDASTNDNIGGTLQRATCIGKFHRDIEPTLLSCRMSSSGAIFIESQSGDLKLKISAKYQKRSGTFRRQPSKRSEAVFGKSIEKIFAASTGLIDGIPRIIVKCIDMVERDGLNETGIYRVCCVASDLQKLRQEFDRNIRRAEEMLMQKNVHVAANLLKLFFRELPEPLFTSALYKQFLQAIQLTDLDNQRILLMRVFESLHTNNKRICFYLFDHLIRVSQYSNINKMHLDNLAVVFGPTLMRPASTKLTLAPTNSIGSSQRSSGSSGSGTQTDLDQMSSELQGSMYQCQVVLACLKLRRDGILK